MAGYGDKSKPRKNMKPTNLFKTITLPIPLLAMLAAVSAQAQGTTTFIDFETFPNGIAVPGGTEITTQYASLGIIFGSVPISGATHSTTIVDYVGTTSGRNELGPNGPRPAIGGTLILTFATPVRSVGSFFIDDQKPVVVTAFDASGNIVGRARSDGTEVGFDSWQITDALGISRVEMAGGYFIGGPDGWGIDDLRFTLIPEPAAVSIFLMGLLSLLGCRWRRRWLRL